MTFFAVLSSQVVQQLICVSFTIVSLLMLCQLLYTVFGVLVQPGYPCHFQTRSIFILKFLRINYFLNQGLGNKWPIVNRITKFRKKKFTKRLEFKVNFTLFRLVPNNMLCKRLDPYFNTVCILLFRTVILCIKTKCQVKWKAQNWCLLSLEQFSLKHCFLDICHYVFKL